MSEPRIRIIRRVPKPSRRPTRLNAFILWLIAAVGLVASSFLNPFIGSLTEGLNPHVQMLVLNLIYYLPFTVLPVILLAKRTPGLYMAYRPNPITFFNTLSISVAAVLGVFFANDLVVLWSIPLQEMGFDVLSASLPSAQNSFELMLSVLCIAVLPGVCEEFLFRGAILSAFEREGTRRAIWASSLLFMLVHGSITGMPAHLVLGMVLSFLVIWTDSIYAGLIYHTVHNSATVLLQFSQDRAAVHADVPAQAERLLDIIGGPSGIPLLIMEILLSGGMILITLKLFKLRGRLLGITTEPRRKVRLRTAEWIVLLLGLILCALLYAADAAFMLGG